jgi:hypothetical protein
MPENVQPETMATWMRDVERRLRLAESGNRAVIQQYGALVPPNTLQILNDAAWTPMWEFRMGRVIADAVSVQVVITTTAGTTAQVRLADAANGWTTDSVTVGPADSKLCAFDWIVPNLLEVYLNQPGPLIYVEARRTGGAGVTSVFLPQVALQGSSYDLDATANGNPRTL